MRNLLLLLLVPTLSASLLLFLLLPLALFLTARGLAASAGECRWRSFA